METCEDPVAWLAIGRLFFPLDERIADEGMDGNGFLRGLRFARSYETVNDGSGHVHRSCGEIDIIPFQSKRFALPITG